MAQQLVLAFDVVNQALVFFNGSAGALPQFRQGAYNTTIYLVRPVPGAIPGVSSYEPIDATEYDGIRVGIWSHTTGDTGDENNYLLALTPQEGWTYDISDPDLPCFTGVFNTHTDEMAGYIGGEAYKDAYFAVNQVKGLDLYPVFDHKQGAKNCTINSATDAGPSFSIVMTQGTPFLPVGTQIRGANGEVWAFVADPNNVGNLLITRVN